MIKLNPELSGIKMFDFKYLLSSYANDKTFFLKNNESAIELLNTFNIFSIYSGLKMVSDVRTIDLNNTQIDNQQVYCSNVPQIDITNKKNSGLMLTCILLYYTCVVMVLAKDYEKFRCSFKLNCSVRFGCLIIGIMMSLLMYIGSFHLRNGNATVWQVLYLLVSYTCMHGALLVIVPSNAKINVTERINEVDKSICFPN